MNHAIADICYRASRLNPEVAREPGDCFIRGQWRPGDIHWGTNMTVCRNWQDLAWTDFRSLPDDTVAILPVAAVEQHGPHLPVSVDATINAGLMVRALALLPEDATVLALPMQSVGLSVEHVRFPGTLTLSAETLIAVLTEIGRSVARAGVRRLVVLNSHGGQPQVVEIVCRRLRADAMLAVSCMASRLGLPPGVSLSRDEARHGIHGGLVETSMMLHLRPDLVRMQHAADFRSAWLAQEASMSVLSPEGAVGFGWETQDLHQSGALGDASAASAVLGGAILEHQAARLATLLGEVRRLDLGNWLKTAHARHPPPEGAGLGREAD
jgi:creatinine amidohydrolase